MRISRWDQVLSSEESNEILFKLASWHLEAVSDPKLGSEIGELLALRNLPLLCDYSLDYSTLSAGDAISIRQILAFFSKRVDIEIGVDRRKVAAEKFVKSERACSETNEIFALWRRGKFQFPRVVESVLYRSSQKIAKVLGDVPSLEQLRARFGPGATTQLPKRTASSRAKLGQMYCCSEDLLGLVKDCLEEMPAWIPFGDKESALVTVEVTPGRLRFVPKTAKTDRAICVEPMLNSMFQLGIGSYISSRLMTVGVNLRDQSRNQRLAREGSLQGNLATLDLSSASDSISRELVYHLLPIDWCLFLDYFRTGCIEVDDDLVPIMGSKFLKLHKFSSMGNGFTFPLESLIFWAIASSCVEAKGLSTVSVYGDDIIVPTEAYDLTVMCLRACGFEVNADKSFSCGPFRESCGADFLSGIDIRPIYIKDRLTGADLFRLHNHYAREFDPVGASIVLDHIDPQIRIWGPDGYGDGHLIGDYDPRPHNRENSNPHKPSGWSGYTFDTFTFKARKSYKPYPGDYVYPSYSIYASSIEEDESLTDVQARINSLCGVGRGQSRISWRGDLWGVTLPGRRGYKRISIYTLTP